jgi:hypothetical protein
LSEEKKKDVSQVELIEVSTASALQFKLPDGTVVDLLGYLKWLGNVVLEIKRSTV